MSGVEVRRENQRHPVAYMPSQSGVRRWVLAKVRGSWNAVAGSVRHLACGGVLTPAGGLEPGVTATDRLPVTTHASADEPVDDEPLMLDQDARAFVSELADALGDSPANVLNLVVRVYANVFGDRPSTTAPADARLVPISQELADELQRYADDLMEPPYEVAEQLLRKMLDRERQPVR